MLYRQHCIANLSVGTLLSVSLGAWDLGFKFQMIFAGAFLVSTFFLSPDLDLFHSAPNRNWKFLRIVWWPYSKLFRHRGWSHMPGIGACTRIAYLLAWVCLGFAIYDLFLEGLSFSALERGLSGRSVQIWTLIKDQETV